MFRKKIETLFSLLIVGLLAWLLWEARAWPPHARLFPWSVEFCVLGLAVAQLGMAFWSIFRAEPAVKGADSDQARPAVSGEEASRSRQGDADRKVTRRRVIVMQGWIVVFFLGIWLLGFKVGSLFLTFAFLKFTASEKWSVSAALAVGIYLFFLIVFDIALKVPLGNGFVADYFGLDSLDSYIIRRPILGFFAG